MKLLNGIEKMRKYYKGAIKKSRAGKPLVSIVTPVLNGNTYFEQTILSVLGQTYDNIEYIIIDGSSTDGSLETIKKYADKIEYWLSEADSTMYDAVNKGLKVASGDILAYLCSDDLYYPDTVQIVVDHFQKYPNAELVYGNCDFIGPKGEIIYKYRFPRYRWQQYICFSCSSLAEPATFWRSSIHKKIGYFDTSFRYAADFDFYAKAGKYCCFSRIKKTIARYRMHASAITAKFREKIKQETDIVRQKYVRINKLYQFILRIWLHLKIKSLNLPVMLKKAYFRIKGIKL